MLLYIGLLLVILAFYRFLYKPVVYWKWMGVKQGNPLPLVGDMAPFIFRKRSMPEWLIDEYQNFSNERYVGSSQFLTPNLVIRDPELIKKITIKDFDHFTDHKRFLDVSIDTIFGRSLFFLPGNEWREMRATLSGSFTSSKMKSLFGLIKVVSDNVVAHLLEQDKNILEIELKDMYTRYANDVIATCAFGYEVDSFKDPKNDFFIMGQKITNFATLSRAIKFFAYTISPTLYKFFNIPPLFERNVTNYFKTLIEDTIKQREEKGIKRPDMINILLEAREGILKRELEVIDSGFAVVQESLENINYRKAINRISDDDIASQALIFFFAGFDSSSTLMSFLTYELAVNPDIQSKLRNEVKNTFKECSGDLTYDGLLKMKYLDMIVTEALRKYPSIIGTDRLCVKAYTIEPERPGEVPIHVAPGDCITIPIIGIHHDAQYYPDPDKFIPERFSDENKDHIKPYTYLPFGIGPRSCIGSRFALLENKCIVFKLLLNFELVPVTSTQIPVKFCKKTLGIGADKGLWIGLKRHGENSVN